MKLSTLPTLLLSSLLFAPQASARWLEAVKSERGDVFYYDSQTFNRDGHIVRVWEISSMNTQAVFARAPTSFRTLTEYDCKERRERRLYMTSHTGKMADGERLSVWDQPEEWRHVPPDTVLEARLRHYCKLAHSPQSNSAPWVELARNLDGDTFYYDPNTVERNGETIKVWELVSRAKPADGRWSSQSLKEYDCKQNKFRYLSVSRYPKPMGEGELISRSNTIGNWLDPAPKSVSEGLVRRFCNPETLPPQPVTPSVAPQPRTMPLM